MGLSGPWITQRLYHTHTFLHTDVIHTNTFTHRDVFAHKTLLDTKVFWYTNSFAHKPFYNPLLHANTFAHRRFCTQTFLHTDTLTHKHVGRKTLQWAGGSHDSHMALTRPISQYYLAMLLSNPTHEEVERQWRSSLVSQQPAMLPCYLHMVDPSLCSLMKLEQTDGCGYLAMLLRNFRRKFRSQTSDSMDRWKAETGRVREEKRREEERRSKKRKSQKKEDPSARKVRKVAKHCVFQWFVAPEGRKVGSLKRRVRSQMSKKCTPLWREAHSEVKMCKTSQLRSTFKSWDVEKVHAVVAQSTFPSHFWTFRCCFAWQAQWIVHLVRSEQNVRFCRISKKRWQAWDLKRICKDEFSVAGAVQDTCSSELLGGPGADFLRGVAFWSIRSSILGRWFCVTGATLRMTWHHFFVAGAIF